MSLPSYSGQFVRTLICNTRFGECTMLDTTQGYICDQNTVIHSIILITNR